MEPSAFSRITETASEMFGVFTSFIQNSIVILLEVDLNIPVKLVYFAGTLFIDDPNYAYNLPSLQVSPEEAMN